MVEFADVRYSDADRIRFAVNQLNAYNPAGFYQSFLPNQVDTRLERFEFRYIRRNGSWLNMAEV